jgi:hypothetical protein
MMHSSRRYQVERLRTFEQLAEKLFHHTWTCCHGFQVGELIALNDATCEDGAQEYAIIVRGRQVESLTVSWMTTEADVLEALLGSLSSGLDLGPVIVRKHPEGACHLCQ